MAKLSGAFFYALLVILLLGLDGCTSGSPFPVEGRKLKQTHEGMVDRYNPGRIFSTTPKPTAGAYGSATSDRRYVCPYEGCDKAYIHEYKLKLHLRREHPGHMSDENATPNVDNEMDDASNQDASAGKHVSGKGQKQTRPKPNLKMPLAKIRQRRGSSPSSATLNVVKKQWAAKEETFEEEDSEETEEEDHENGEDGWRYGENNEEDDEETSMKTEEGSTSRVSNLSFFLSLFCGE